jgi:hypothetical protein
MPALPTEALKIVAELTRFNVAGRHRLAVSDTAILNFSSGGGRRGNHHHSGNRRW